VLNNSKILTIQGLTLIFLLFLWFVNPSNKLIILFFFFLLGSLVYLTKKLDISLILTYFLSSFFLVGKTYFIQRFDISQFPYLMQFYPMGLVSQVQISVSDVLFVFLFVYFIIIGYRKKIKFKKIALIDIFLIIFFFYGIFSDIFVSSNLFLSLYFKKNLFEYIFMYFTIKYIVDNQSFLFKSFLAVLVSLVLFEVFVSLLQFINSSPLGKALEANSKIDAYSGASDELTFIFRPSGTFIHANNFAMFLATISPIYLFLMIKSKQYIYKLMFFLTSICLILTSSRAAWLVTLISSLSILFYFEYHKRINLTESLSIKRILYFLIICVPLLFYSFPRIMEASNIFQKGGGFTLRVRQTQEVLGLISQSPLFGVGTGMAEVKAMEKNPNSVFAEFPSEIHVYPLLIAVENGLPYLGLFVIFLFHSFKKLIIYKKTLLLVVFIGLSSMITIGLFQPFLISNLLFIFLAFDYAKINEDHYGY